MQEDFFNKIFTSHFIARVRKGLLKVCMWEGAGEWTETSIFWPPLLWPSTLSFSFSRCSTEGPGPTLLGASLVPKLHRGFRGPPRPGVAFPTTSRLSLRLQLQLPWLLSWLSYIIVQRPLDRWNCMFDRHQAEITVMQFTGHSLPVRQSEYTMGIFYLVPFYQPISAHTISSHNCH